MKGTQPIIVERNDDVIATIKWLFEDGEVELVLMKSFKNGLVQNSF